ncbi:MAG TPA: hypothetical protein VJJ83_01740 [Candidatus Babeliales bacterium]|nr:hypothetical protein [Candidatus Babeliales bacterium]
MKSNRSYLLMSLLLLGAKATLAMSEPDTAAQANVGKAAKELGISVEIKRTLDRADEGFHQCIELTTKLTDHFYYIESYDATLKKISECHSRHGDVIFEAVVAKDLLTNRRLAGPSSPILANSLEEALYDVAQECCWEANHRGYSSRLPGALGEWRIEHKRTTAEQKCEKLKEQNRQSYIDRVIKAEIAVPILYEYTRCVSTEPHSPTDCQKRLVDDLRNYDKGGLAALTASKR